MDMNKEKVGRKIAAYLQQEGQLPPEGGEVKTTEELAASLGLDEYEHKAGDGELKL